MPKTWAVLYGVALLPSNVVAAFGRKPHFSAREFAGSVEPTPRIASCDDCAAAGFCENQKPNPNPERLLR